MFIGHYGPALAAKPADRRVPLWLLFLAAQWMDVWWGALVLLGVEKLRVVPGLMQASPLDLYYMPFTHGLLGALLLAIMTGVLVSRVYRGGRGRVLLVVAAVVFSHWLLDLVVHRPDLPLWLNEDKVGFGLWRWAYLSVPLELALLLAGALIYARTMPAKPGQGMWLWLFVAFMAAVELYNQFAPPPPGPRDMAMTALFAYGALALLAWLVERTRQRS